MMEECPGFVRMMYRFGIVNGLEEVQEQFNLISQSLTPSGHVNIDLKGFISHNKKNRTNVKVNYSRL